MAEIGSINTLAVTRLTAHGALLDDGNGDEQTYRAALLYRFHRVAGGIAQRNTGRVRQWDAGRRMQNGCRRCRASQHVLLCRRAISNRGSEGGRTADWCQNRAW